MNRLYIVSWSTPGDGMRCVDDWRTANTYTDARRIYADAMQGGARMAHISIAIESADSEEGDAMRYVSNGD